MNAYEFAIFAVIMIMISAYALRKLIVMIVLRTLIKRDLEWLYWLEEEHGIELGAIPPIRYLQKKEFRETD